VAKVHDNGGIIGKTLDFSSTDTYITGNKKNSGIWNLGAAVKTEPPASYDALIVDYSGSEGSDMRFVLQTSNIPDGTTVNYYLSGTGIGPTDFTSGFDYGSATINSNQALITIGLSADALTEGTETVTITLNPTDNSGNPTGSLSASTTIADTSKTVAYSISIFSDTTPDEGSDVIVEMYVRNSTETIYWTINGTTSDFTAVSGSLSYGGSGSNWSYSGAFEDNGDTVYVYSLQLSITADLLSEGNEAFTFSLRSGSTSGTVQATQAFTVQDTSISPPITYSIYSFSDTTPNEGSTVNVEMRVSNSNPTIYWSTNATNDTLPPSSGTASYIGTTVIGNDTYYRYTASFTITEDTTTEGNEAYTFYMRTGSTSGTIQDALDFTIQDTSLDPPSGGGTGLSDVLATYSGQYSSSLWQQVNLSSSFSQFVGSTGRLVFQYTSGSSFRGDIQLDDINIANNNYSFEINGQNWQTTTNGSTTTTYTDAFYQGLAWTSVAGASANRWGRDSGGTPSSSTGLSSADAGSFYLFVETSGSGSGYKVSWLRSPEIVLDTNTLNFALGRYGSNMGTLRVFWETTVPASTELYSFTSHTFTNAGKTGNTGPTLAQCTATYSATTWASNTSYFNMTTTGIQLWTVPATGTYRIAAYGAEGGLSTDNILGGRGAFIQGDFNLTSGDVLQILVGQKGLGLDRSAAGGGGTFVVKSPYSSTSDILVIAGGGGGGAHGSGVNKTGRHGTTSNNGTSGQDNALAGGTGGSGGAGTSGNWGGAGGGGLTGNGGNNKYSGTAQANTGGKAFTAGGNGGVDSGLNYSTAGGFGGGGGSSWGSGGGGGYSGGAADDSAGSGSDKNGGGGGGSYNNGSNQVNTDGSGHTRTGHGEVTITKL
jgi:hypothetical protein